MVSVAAGAVAATEELFICAEACWQHHLVCRYVNINYLGLHKILKKHDKNIPDMRVHAFYANWIHREKWLSGDYSEELVMLSDVFSKLRGDAAGVKNEDSAQVGRHNPSYST